jgi:hypothetical protein
MTRIRNDDRTQEGFEIVQTCGESWGKDAEASIGVRCGAPTIKASPIFGGDIKGYLHAFELKEMNR